MSSPLTSSIEDYLEAILALSFENKAVRVTDIAERLGVAKASVTQAVNVLKEKGLVTQERYGRVYLTDDGIREAGRVRKRHRVLRFFLRDVLGVNENTAERDACLMEHAVSPETMERLIKFLEKNVSMWLPKDISGGTGEPGKGEGADHSLLGGEERGGNGGVRATPGGSVKSV